MKTIQQLMQSDFVNSSHHIFSMSKCLCSRRSYLSFELNESSFSVGILALASILSWIFVYNTMLCYHNLNVDFVILCQQTNCKCVVSSRIYLCDLFVYENIIYLTAESFLSLLYCHLFFFETHKTANLNYTHEFHAYFRIANEHHYQC